MAKNKPATGKSEPSKVIDLESYRKQRDNKNKRPLQKDGVEFICPHCAHGFELSWQEIETIEEDDGLEVDLLVCPRCGEQLNEASLASTYDDDDIPF